MPVKYDEKEEDSGEDEEKMEEKEKKIEKIDRIERRAKVTKLEDKSEDEEDEEDEEDIVEAVKEEDQDRLVENRISIYTRLDRGGKGRESSARVYIFFKITPPPWKFPHKWSDKGSNGSVANRVWSSWKRVT